MKNIIVFLVKILFEVVKFWLVVVLYRLVTIALSAGWSFLKAAWLLAFKK